MVIYRIIPLAIFACLAVSGHVGPTSRIDLTIDEYDGGWFTLALASEEPDLLNVKCSWTEATKVDNETINLVITTARLDHTRPTQRGSHAKFIHSTLHTQNNDEDFTYKMSKFINGNQFIVHAEQPPYSYELMSRTPKAPEYVMEEFKKLAASSNLTTLYIDVDNCPYNRLYELNPNAV